MMDFTFGGLHEQSSSQTNLNELLRHAPTFVLTGSNASTNTLPQKVGIFNLKGEIVEEITSDEVYRIEIPRLYHNQKSTSKGIILNLQKELCKNTRKLQPEEKAKVLWFNSYSLSENTYDLKLKVYAVRAKNMGKDLEDITLSRCNSIGDTCTDSPPALIIVSEPGTFCVEFQSENQGGSTNPFIDIRFNCIPHHCFNATAFRIEVTLWDTISKKEAFNGFCEPRFDASSSSFAPDHVAKRKFEEI